MYQLWAKTNLAVKKKHIFMLLKLLENDVGNYGPRLPGVGGDMPQQVRSGVGGELPHQQQKSGVGSNILQQNGSVSKSDTRPDLNSGVGRSKNGLVSKNDTRPDCNSEVGKSKNGSVSKSDTRPDRGNLALSIAGGDVARYDVREQRSWGGDTDNT